MDGPAAPALPGSCWPLPADAGAGGRLIERFAARSEAAAAIAGCPEGAAMLAAVGGGSPFLADLVVREHACVEQFWTEGPNVAVQGAMAALAAVGADAARGPVMAAMRRAKRQVAVVTALADIGGQWTLSRITAALTALAEACLRVAVGHLLLVAHRTGALQLPDPAHPEAGSGLVVLGMGKLGARELNYSSDIDLILLFDPDCHNGSHNASGADPDLLGPDSLGRDSLGQTFTRLARGLVTMMEARDADGYVFRTDLRLRPDPAATPPAVALPAAIAYYESMGQNWERAAMTKARPVAGDLVRGWAFLEAIRPFVWRRQLDFAAIADLHAMKRRIEDHYGLTGREAGLAGFDVKLGPGGIREVEFAAQTLQLVWGGRDPALRERTTLGALRGLVRAGHLPRRAAAELTVAYRALRRVEHRLQMVADRQTHAMPERAEELERFAVFLGCADAGALATGLGRHLAMVRARYSAVFGGVPDAPDGSAPPLDLAGPDLPAETVRRLEQMGYREAAGMVGVLRGWRAGRVRALRSVRARELMDAMLPALLEALAGQADPDGAFHRFDAMLSRQPAGVQLLSMFQRNTALLTRVAAVLGAAPSLADHLAQVPSALEGLLEPLPAPMADPAAVLAGRLSGAEALEDVLGVTRRFVRAQEFSLCVAQMQGELDVDGAGRARTALADAALETLLPAVLAEHARRHGWVRGGDMAVVALGKAGSREMMAGSDLDLLLLYTLPPGVAESGGPRRLPVSQYFIRAAHSFVAALTAPGMEGPLYDVDMRLRPSGNKGPVAVPLAGFAVYHASEAWTWERMALTRARVIAGNPAVRRRAERAIAAALARTVDPATTQADAAAMRGRLMRELPGSGPWDVKMRPGGGMEVEFIAQVLQLVHGVVPAFGETGGALRHLGAIGALTGAEAELLVRADLVWRTVQSMLRITVGRAVPPTRYGALPRAAAAALLRAVGEVLAPSSTGGELDVAGLHATLDETAGAVRAIFNARIGVVG